LPVVIGQSRRGGLAASSGRWTFRTWESNILRNKTFCSKEFPVSWNLVAGHEEQVPWTKLSSGLDVITSSGFFMGFSSRPVFAAPILCPTLSACRTVCQSRHQARNTENPVRRNSVVSLIGGLLATQKAPTSPQICSRSQGQTIKRESLWLEA